MVTHSNFTAAEVLEGLLPNRYLEYQGRKPLEELGGFTYYNELKQREGEAAADAALKEWYQEEHRRRNLAAEIAPVAQGMLALARVDTSGEYTKVVDAKEKMRFPQCFDLYRFLPPQIVVVFNRDAPRCDCAELLGSKEFGLGGSLGLIAVTVQAGDSRSRLDAIAGRLCLVFQSRTTYCGYNTVSIDLTGLTSVDMYAPKISPNAYLFGSLGLIGEDEVISHWDTHCDGDDTLGFPSADYLADALPRLGQYFTDLAARLTEHTTDAKCDRGSRHLFSKS